jgi:hypothetical protein
MTNMMVWRGGKPHRARTEVAGSKFANCSPIAHVPIAVFRFLMQFPLQINLVIV